MTTQKEILDAITSDLISLYIRGSISEVYFAASLLRHGYNARDAVAEINQQRPNREEYHKHFGG